MTDCYQKCCYEAFVLGLDESDDDFGSMGMRGAGSRPALSVGGEAGVLV